MDRTRIFISSVQDEFSRERAALFDYLQQDALLGRFFEPYIFERSKAEDKMARDVYLGQLGMCDIYIGLFGEKYGYEDADGISPTEREYDLATELHKTRLIYIKKAANRDKKESVLINKIEKDVVRKSFTEVEELKTEVYASLIRYLEEKELLRFSPFDATFNRTAELEDIDEQKVKKFIARAKAKRGFPFNVDDDYKTVLSHLELIKGDRVTNAAILLFGRKPQKFFITSSVKCCQFYGNNIVKPIPSYHIYDGDVFELIDQAVSFVMSRVDAKVGGRDKTILADVELELPLQAVTEAIVNAVCHRDYTSNASVQVMLFRNRLEIWNPGQLPHGLTAEMLTSVHPSRPANPLLARPMYLYGSIEQMGTGTEMIVKKCRKHGLQLPEFKQSDVFKLIFWRKSKEAVFEDNTENVTDDPDNDPGMFLGRGPEGIYASEKAPEGTERGTEIENGPEKFLGSNLGGSLGSNLGKITDKQLAILTYVEQNQRITTLELSALVKISERSIRENISKLKAKGLIERIGPDRGGHWRVIK